MKRQWIPIGDVKTIIRNKYRYEVGWYNHHLYGKCFRISKFIKENDYFIGHFVIVGDDLEIMNDINEVFKRGFT